MGTWTLSMAPGGHEVKGLEDEADAVGAVLVKIDGRAEGGVFKEDVAAGGYVKAAEQMEQGGFAAAAGSADGNVVPRRLPTAG